MPERKPIMQAGCPRGHLEVYGDSGRWELHVSWGETHILQHATGGQVLEKLEHIGRLLADPIYDQVAAPIQAAFRVIAASGK